MKSSIRRIEMQWRRTDSIVLLYLVKAADSILYYITLVKKKTERTSREKKIIFARSRIFCAWEIVDASRG